MTGTSPLAEVEFAENPEARCPCILLLDTSGSMQGEPIKALNAGLQTFRDSLNQDDLASRRVEIAVVTFDSKVTVVQDFVTADRFVPPTLAVQGVTRMGGGIQQALDLLQSRKALYKSHGMQFFRPWVFMITDGAPQGETDDIVARAAQRIKDEENAKRVVFFAVGVEGADMARLASVSARQPVKLIGLNFRDMFVWLSTSMQLVSHSQLGDVVPLPPPAGWGNA
jgi:uncharacterized protein YegL